MGLELVELAMGIEDEFDITISDEDAQELTTCQKVAEYIIAHVPDIKLQAQSCATQAQFYRLRQRLIHEFNIPRKTIHPKTPLQQLLNGDIKSQWNKLQSHPEFSHFPSLKCKSYITFLFSIIFSGIFLFVLVTSFSFFIALASTVILWFLWVIFIHPKFANQIPDEYKTVGELATITDLYSSPPEQTYFDLHPPTQEIDSFLYRHTLYRVTRIASEVLGIPAKQIRPDAHFVIDLGAS